MRLRRKEKKQAQLESAWQTTYRNGQKWKSSILKREGGYTKIADHNNNGVNLYR